MLSLTKRSHYYSVPAIQRQIFRLNSMLPGIPVSPTTANSRRSLVALGSAMQYPIIHRHESSMNQKYFMINPNN